MTATALQSLYGGKASALAGNAGKQIREQEVLTPDWILDAARTALGGRIVLDPCASTNPENWIAETNVCLSEAGQGYRAALRAGPEDKDVIRDLKRLYKAELLGGALTYDWDIGPTFCNPPFSVLEAWMRKCQAAPVPVVLLCPARVARTWWWQLAGGQYPGTDLVFLAPFAYKGYTQSLPEPGALVGYRCKIPDLGARETRRQKQIG